MRQSILNPFEKYVGADRLRSPLILITLFVIYLLSALIIAKFGIVSGFMLIVLPFGLLYLYLLFINPIIGLYTAVAAGFLLLGIGRYVTDVQVGLGMDAILSLTFLALFFKQFYTRIDWNPVKKDVMLLAFLWLMYAIFQLVNPEAQSSAAWFSGRGSSLYMFLLIPLALLLIDNNYKLNIFFYTWGIFSILATIKGIMQINFGLDPYEQAWLNIEGNRSTHILFGKLRVFSFLSDAGQFGANQGYSGVMATIMALNQNNWKNRIFFALVALLGFYGMMISGTRGAISVPFAGFSLYFILKKNLPVMIGGFILLAGFFIFFKFTSIGQDNPEIRRMRSAFDPNNPSLQVRLANQKKLSSYLASRPFGGGIGHAGGKARKFLPNAFLTNTPPDSWYVLIWAEQGIVGLTLHLAILFYIIIKSSWKIMYKIRDPIVKMKMAALTCGMFGIMAASYGNMVLGQMPTSILIYTSMALMLNSEVFDEHETQDEVIKRIELKSVYTKQNLI
jgi:hypothetical protein